MSTIDRLLIDAAAKALAEDLPTFKQNVSATFNLYEEVDSFSLVNVLLETESDVEKATGKYIPLANEKIFDASQSPFLKWTDWVSYVGDTVKGAGMQI